MVSIERIRGLLHALATHSDWRFAIGVRIRFANPTLLYQTYPEEWANYYNENALFLVDPTIRWGLAHTGICKWDDLIEEDAAGMMALAAAHGLRYGIVVSTGEAASRTLGFFCHAERPLTEAEVAFAATTVQQIHDATDGLFELPETTLNQLRTLTFTERLA